MHRSEEPRPHDDDLMRLALAEAARARGRTSPNPLVGVILVDERGPSPRVVARGFHARAGTAHAEVAALRDLGGPATGLTAYVTLEPCNHVGRTGKCTDALIAAGVSRVVVGLLDPNPHVEGGGVARLRAAGLAVTTGVLADECRRQNRAFVRWIMTGLPHLLMKAAISLDGRLAPAGPGPGQPGPGQPIWLTGPAARLQAHRLRDEVDAVLVGAGTVQADDPQLTVRLPPAETRDERQPLRVVLDGRLRLPAERRIFSPGTLLVATDQAAAACPDHLSRLRDRGVDVLLLPGDAAGEVDLAALCRALGQRQILSALCEGGAGLHGGLLRAGLYQEAALFVAPLLLGDDAVPLCRGPGLSGLRLSRLSAQPIGPDVLLRGDFAVPPGDPG